jgi:hypothetical protein
MITLDLRKQWKSLYTPSARTVDIVAVPVFRFVMIDGVVPAGESPGESAGFAAAMQALYGAAYTLKFMSKKSQDNPLDYPVMALEGLWWVESGRFDFAKKEDWQYTLMIMQPDHITPEMLKQACRQVRTKHEGASSALDHLRLASFDEGLCMQTMHIGPYSDEPATIERMKSFAQQHGYTARGKHHEIYLGDPRRAKPENMRTVLRQPIASV